MSHRLRILTSLAFAGLLVTQPGASCVSDSTTGGTGTGTSQSTGTPTPPATDGVDVNYVPTRAEIVRDGRGVLTYTADADGTAYVQDVRKELTIVTHRIHRGETLVVSPDDNRVRLEGEKISDADIKSDAEHRIYLLRDRRFDDRDNASRDDRTYATLPPQAEKIDEGKNKTLSAWAKRDGRMYVYDVDAKRVATSVPVAGGQRVVVAPGDDRITVNGETVSTKNFSTKTTYRLYFSDAR